MGAVSIERGKGDTTTVEKLTNECKNGTGIMIFPEGTRTKTGKLGVIKSGAFVIAAAAGADMLPVRIIYGTKDGRLHLFCKVRIVFGEPIPAADLQIRDQSHKMAELRRMHAMKTGALLRASCVCGALLAGAADDVCERIGRYGAALGVAFQIADDILDVVSDTATLGKPAGSDAEQGKNTYPALVGLDESRRLAREQADAACAALAGFSGPEAEFLRALAEYTITRAA